MNKHWITAAALMVGATALAAPKDTGNRLQGDYVEARTASVFAGACHYGGEVTTTGREGAMAWRVREGSWNGVSLDGLSAFAAVQSEASLSTAGAARRSEVFIDARATEDQANALRAALTTEYAEALGRVVAVKRASISFRREGENFRVNAPGAGRLSVDALPDRSCCTQPHLVWYEPLVPITERRVGFTRASEVFADASLGTAWSKSGQNTAFYGQFAF